MTDGTQRGGWGCPFGLLPGTPHSWRGPYSGGSLRLGGSPSDLRAIWIWLQAGNKRAATKTIPERGSSHSIISSARARSDAGQPERLRPLKIDHQLELGRLLNR